MTLAEGFLGAFVAGLVLMAFIALARWALSAKR